MSPEVANRTKYNQGTDVFSFGLVLFEILSLNQPKVEEGCRTVNQAHLHFCHCWPISVTSLLRQALSPVIAERPTMEEIHKVLSNQIRVLDERLRELNTNGSKAAGGRMMLPQLRLDDESVDTLSISTIGMQDAM
jgi:serine/threonine protein kinase